MKTIGERVRALRLAKGYERQRDLGNLVGVDQSIISDIERGAGFKAHVLMGICEHLGTTPEFIMLGDERNSAGEAEMLALYRNTSDEGRAAMVVMARSLRASYPRMEIVSNPVSGNVPRENTGTPSSLQADTNSDKRKGFRGSGRITAPTQSEGLKNGRSRSIAVKPTSKGSGGRA